MHTPSPQRSFSQKYPRTILDYAIAKGLHPHGTSNKTDPQKVEVTNTTEGLIITDDNLLNVEENSDKGQNLGVIQGTRMVATMEWRTKAEPPLG